MAGNVVRGSVALVRELSEAFGPPGGEDEVRRLIRDRMPSGASVSVDRFGNIICEAGAQAGPRLMLEAHLDELGLMVSNVDADGFLRVAPLGGWWPPSVVDKKWTVRTARGKVTGISNTFNPHIIPDGLKRIPEMKEIFLDVGARTREDAEDRLGVAIGDLVVPDAPFFSLDGDAVLCGKAFDDRVGCALMVESFTEAVQKGHHGVLIAAGCAQEEVGMRGINAALNSVRPDAAVILEICPALDYPGTKREDAPECRLGHGPVLHLLDGGSVANRRFVEYAREIAADLRLAVQLWASAAVSNDGRAVQYHEQGVPTLVLGVPLRYLHGHLGLVRTADYQAALRLLKAIVARLDARRCGRLFPV